MRNQSIAELAWITHPSINRHKGMALLTAYFDESGTHLDSEIVLIAGFVATSEKWTAVEAAWRQRLDVLNLSYYHASACDAGDEAFADIPRELRAGLSFALAGVIADHQLMSVNAAIMRADWDLFKSGEIGKRFIGPYNFCFEYCMQQISSWSKREASGESVALVFAEQKEYQPRAREIYDLYRKNPRWNRELASLTFAPAEKYPSLQAADLIVYETYRYALARHQNANAPLRAPMQRMVNADVRVIGGYYDAEALAGLLKQQSG
jgi:hypothetical protein